VQKIQDHELVKKTAQRAYDDIVASGRHSYRAFIEHFEVVIEDFMKSRQNPGGEPVPAVQPVPSVQPTLMAQYGSPPAEKKLSWKFGRMATRILSFILNYVYQKVRWFFQVTIQKVMGVVTRLRDRAARRKLVHPFFKKEKMKLLVTLLKDA